MAKRRGEPLQCHVPVKRQSHEHPSSQQPCAVAAPGERPRGGGAGVEAAAPNKRKFEEIDVLSAKRTELRGRSARGAQEGQRQRGGSAEPRDVRLAEECAAGGCSEERAATAASEQEEELCQYNSFIYWRTPLPAIDLTDIQNLDGETASEAKTLSRTDAMETEMETG